MLPLLRGLRDVVGEAHVLTDPELTQPYERDWLGRHAGTHSVVVRPADVNEVSEVLRLCCRARVPVVPQGGNTGLVGGGVPHAGEVVVSTRRLLDGFEVDLDGGQVSLPAGMTVSAAQDSLRGYGVELGVDLASRDSATIGGVVATNAGGLRVPRFGHIRQQLVGLEAVLADGSRFEQMSGLTKDNTGYHLPSLVCGSEGMLAVVTRARLRVWPVAHQRVTAVLALDDLTACIAALRGLREAVSGFESAEVIFADGVELAVERGAQRAFAAPAPVELLVEFAARGHDEPDLLQRVLAAVSQVVCRDAALASDPSGRRRLWERRERHPELVTGLDGVPLKLDTAVPVGVLASYEKAVRAAVGAADPQATLVLYGHAADGNLHVNVAARPERAAEVRDAVFRVVRGHRGSISAEHGIGWDKRDRLSWARTSEEIAVMSALKHAFDPAGILNPNVLLPAS